MKLGILLILLWIGATEAHASDDAAALYEQGQTAFQQHDIQTAYALFEQASLLGHGPSKVQLGWILDSIGEHSQAIELYRKAAQSENREGQYFLGEKLIAGQGTSENEAEGVKWITKAATAGHPTAIRRLARAHETGDLGLLPDTTEAVRWLQKGLAQNDLWSIQRLAKAYRKGELNLTIDLHRAAQLDTLLENAQ